LTSLGAHLTAAASEHGRLRFHPDCPRCSGRLAGRLSGDELVSRKAKAAVAAGVLALSSAAPAAAIPPELDQEQEGTAAPPAAGGDTLNDPGFDPGGEDVVLEVEVGPVAGEPQAGGQEDTGEGPPVETEPIDDPDARLVLPEESEPAPTSAPIPEAPVTPGPPVASPAPPPPAEVQAPAPDPAPSVPRIDRRDERTESRPKKDEPQRGAAGTEVAPAPPQPATEVVLQEAEPPPTLPASADETETVALAPPSAPIEGDRYRVQPGDSLWSIARRLLGPEASNGRIAKEVNRLWELNRERIATGDRSLIYAGTELQLR
jgi:LysM repeat protein